MGLGGEGIWGQAPRGSGVYAVLRERRRDPVKGYGEGSLRPRDLSGHGRGPAPRAGHPACVAGRGGHGASQGAAGQGFGFRPRETGSQ